jgi:nitrogen fixation protein NifU and related proteins
MSELDDLYQSIILDHNKRPRNFGAPAAVQRVAHGRNPLCGDEVTVWLRLDGDRVAELRFVGQGCAISKASASLMTEAVLGKTREEALALFERAHALFTGKTDMAAERKALGQMAALGGVSRFPVRVKCASLGWHAMKSALLSDAAVDVSTERGTP